MVVQGVLGSKCDILNSDFIYLCSNRFAPFVYGILAVCLKCDIYFDE